MERNCIFPDDLVEEILLRLPAKDLLRYRSVSKGWCSIIDDVSFITKHYQLQYSLRKLNDNMTYFVEKEFIDLCSYEFCLLSIEQGEGEGDVCMVPMNDDLQRDSFPHGVDHYGHITYLGCVNGVICLLYGFYDFFALWNPATREFKTLSYPNNPGLVHYSNFYFHGFGFDLSSKDFKILDCCALVKWNNSIGYEVIYSLKSNSWKQISNIPAGVPGLLPGCSDGYLNGVYYWIYGNNEYPLGVVIVSFNFASELYKVSILPQDVISLVASDSSHAEIALYKEHLALVIIHKVLQEPSISCSLHLWVATQFDDCWVSGSWQHFFTIRPTTHDPRDVNITIKSILMNGNLHFGITSIPKGTSPPEDKIDFREVYLYNHSKGEFKEFDIFWSDSWFRYVESLFTLSKKG